MLHRGRAMPPSDREEREQGAALRVAGYRLRATMRRRWPGYLSLVLCIACLGGFAMGSAAGARRTQSSFTTYLKSTNPPDLEFVSAVLNPQIGNGAGYDPALLRTIARLPHVADVESASGIDVLPLTANGHPLVATFSPAAGNGLGSDDGLFFKVARVTIVSGRLADPRRPDQIMMLREVAELAHDHVGQSIRIGIYSNAQTQLPGFGTIAVRPLHTYVVTLVGTFVLAQNLIEDDFDNQNSASLFYFTPAFTRSLLGCCSNYTESGVQVAGGSGFVQRVDAEILSVLPKGFPPPDLASTATTKAQRSIQPESIALGVFGLIAALAALIIASQVIGRQLRLESEDRRILRVARCRSADRSRRLAVGILTCVVVGSVLAVGIAVALSPLGPSDPFGRSIRTRAWPSTRPCSSAASPSLSSSSVWCRSPSRSGRLLSPSTHGDLGSHSGARRSREPQRRQTAHPRRPWGSGSPSSPAEDAMPCP